MQAAGKQPFLLPGKAGRKDFAMKRPLAYITAPWSSRQYENAENAVSYCRQVYDAGYSPVCPVLVKECNKVKIFYCFL